MSRTYHVVVNRGGAFLQAPVDHDHPVFAPIFETAATFDYAPAGRAAYYVQRFAAHGARACHVDRNGQEETR